MWWIDKPCADCIFWQEDSLSTEDDYYYSCKNALSENYLCRADYINECKDKQIDDN